ncbi:MAG: hypothetical protein HZB51_00920 [Chloroflexi bacterium]|nr:hypothetical protein [Chloroflexota bacterium]
MRIQKYFKPGLGLVYFCLITAMTGYVAQSFPPSTSDLNPATHSEPTAERIPTLVSTSTATARLSRSPTIVPTVTPFPKNGSLFAKLRSVDEDLLHLELENGDIVTFRMPSEIAVAFTTISQNLTTGSRTTQPMDTLRAGINKPLRLQIQNGVLTMALVVVPEPIATSLARLKPMDAISPMADRSPTATIFGATATPVLSHRYVEMPWGLVNLDLPIDETNEYAMAWWCHLEVERVRAQDLDMWHSNPKGMIIGRAKLPFVLNVEILNKDNDWTSVSGTRYLRAEGLIRTTPNRSDTYRIKLRIYEHASLATNIPIDDRMYDRFSIAPVPGIGITDVNQIRIGQIYGFTFYERDARWPRPAEQIDTLIARPSELEGNEEMVIYTSPVKWEATCDYAQQQGWIK